MYYCTDLKNSDMVKRLFSLKKGLHWGYGKGLYRVKHLSYRKWQKRFISVKDDLPF